MPYKNARTCAQGDTCNDVRAVAQPWKGHICPSAAEKIKSAKHMQWNTGSNGNESTTATYNIIEEP